MRVWRETEICPRAEEEGQGNTATAQARREESIFDRSGVASCRPYPPVSPRRTRGQRCRILLEIGPAFLARTGRDSESGPAFCWRSRPPAKRVDQGPSPALESEVPGRLPATIP